MEQTGAFEAMYLSYTIFPCFASYFEKSCKIILTNYSMKKRGLLFILYESGNKGPKKREIKHYLSGFSWESYPDRTGFAVFSLLLFKNQIGGLVDPRSLWRIEVFRPASQNLNAGSKNKRFFSFPHKGQTGTDSKTVFFIYI